MAVLVLNSGSSSVKYQLFDMDQRSVLSSGFVERVGEPRGRHVHRYRDGAALQEAVDDVAVVDHDEAFRRIIDALRSPQRRSLDLDGIGHRVVHGGAEFVEPTLIDEEVIDRIRAQIPLAPLHNPANLRGIEVAFALRPELPHVAVFDTAFHRTLPPHAYRYAVPERLLNDYAVRRYGFHGTSHGYVARRAAQHLGIPQDQCNLITLHLGNGASATAIAGGSSVDTSMGLTPLEGLVMGTRSGDLDPAVIFHLVRAAGMSPDEVERLLTRNSGLKGLCDDNDVRSVVQRAGAGDPAAALALEMFCYRIRKYIGAYYAVLGRVDALVFTAGIGEHSAEVRARSCNGLQRLGIAVDRQRNAAAHNGDILEVHAEESEVAVLVVPTNEELEIAEQTLACIRSR